jgi:hypothetical protein
MRKISFIVFLLVIIVNISYAQYKEIPYETKMKLKNNKGLILGFINPNNLSLTHSINFSYLNAGNTSVSLTSYTGTLSYKVLKNLNVSADITMQYSPYASFGSSNAALNREFQNSFNGINLSRLSLDYKPFKNMFIHFDYVNNRNGYYYYPYGYFYGLDGF